MEYKNVLKFVELTENVFLFSNIFQIYLVKFNGFDEELSNILTLILENSE